MRELSFYMKPYIHEMHRKEHDGFIFKLSFRKLKIKLNGHFVATTKDERITTQMDILGSIFCFW